MKKMYIGGGILALMLAAGVFFSFLMPKLHGPVRENLEQAAKEAFLGNWEAAENRFYDAKAQWEKHHDLTAMVCDHAPQEEMERYFREAEVLLKAKQADFAVLCASLSAMAEDMENLHRVGLEDLL